MSGGRRKRGGKAGGQAQSFAGIPRAVMDHPDYQRLTGNAAKLLLELARQYRGSNNGDLCVAWEVVRKRGFRSKATVQRARDELLDANLIRCTRQGRFLNPGGVCALYALVWVPVDECPKVSLDIGPTTRPLRIFSTLKVCDLPGPESGHGSTSKVGRQDAA